MIKKIIYSCDLCGKELEENYNDVKRGAVFYIVKEEFAYDERDSSSKRKMDLCESCRKKILNSFNNK